MEKENFEESEDLPSKMNQVKEQIEKERCLDINNNGKDNMLLSRMKRPLRLFSGFSADHNEETHILDEDGTLPTVQLPFVEQLPRSITCVFTDRNKLMDKGVSVNGKRQQLYCKSSEEDEKEEETNEQNFEFSKDEDRFIWMTGQEYDLNDLVVHNTLTKFFKLDISYVLERYTKLKLKEENVGKSFDLGSKSIIISFQDVVDRYFCRLCLIFDCHMHEMSQPESKHRENKSYLPENEDDRRQCSERCYLKVRSVREADYVEDNDNSLPNKKQKNVISEDTIWTPVEKDLYLKGVEIFGRNSCLITQNILSGLKTCLEVYNYMHEQDHFAVLLQNEKTTETDNQLKKKVYRKSTKLNSAKFRKYSRYPPALTKQAYGEKRLYKQYTPCICESVCGDECICLINGNCCEKYCGCPKKCNNRFEGCSCAKSECRNRQCPCFAANRECDPDLCRSCQPSYGDGFLGHETSSEQRQCNNMNILLKKKRKRILIAKSGVHGWGAFTRDSLTKNEFLGEYTGELITGEEETERWKEDHNKHGTSYFFDLNDQVEIDARRKGNKFRFLNHSKEPNCFAKVMIVRGDQRISIFAGKDIKIGEELSLDYGYEPEQPAWSRGRVSEMSTDIGPSS